MVEILDVPPLQLAAMICTRSLLGSIGLLSLIVNSVWKRLAVSKLWLFLIEAVYKPILSRHRGPGGLLAAQQLGLALANAAR